MMKENEPDKPVVKRSKIVPDGLPISCTSTSWSTVRNDEIFGKKTKIENLYSIVEKEGKGQICVALKDIKRGTLVSCHDLGRMNFFKKGFGKMQKVGEIVAESVVDYDDPYTKKWKEKNQNFESWYAQNKRVQHSKTRLEKFNAGHYMFEAFQI